MVLDRLRDALGRDAVLSDADVTSAYSRDLMPMAPYG
jgi:glycolate oxidase